MQGLYQDVVSFEQMVESAGVKAQDLMQKSPASKASTDTSQIMTKYHNLKDLAMVTFTLLFSFHFISGTYDTITL